MTVPTTTQAAVLVETGKPLVIMDLGLPALAPGQVLVEIAFSGICHSQLNEVSGRKGPDRFLPHVLGHEGSGRVLATGDGVRKVSPGDEVVLTWLKGEGADVPSTRYVSAGGPVNSGAIATFMRHTVTCESRVVRKPASLTMREAALFGCAVPTGGGVAAKSGFDLRGKSVAVFGAGGVGSAAVAMAAALGANPLIAIDVVPSKLDVARRLGATHCFDGRSENVLQQVREMTGGAGVDLAIEAAGLSSVMEMAFAATKFGGGLCILAGNVGLGEKISIDPYDLIRGRHIRGTWGGESNPDVDIPAFARIAQTEKIDLGAMISQEYPLAAVNDALEDLRAGKVMRAFLSL